MALVAVMLMSQFAHARCSIVCAPLARRRHTLDGRCDDRWFRQGDSGADDYVARPGPGTRPGPATPRPGAQPRPRHHRSAPAATLRPPAPAADAHCCTAPAACQSKSESVAGKC